MTARSYISSDGVVDRPSIAASSASVGLDERLALLGDDDRQPQAVEARGIEQLLALGLVGHERAEGVLVARQELTHLPRPGVPPVADDLGVRDGAVADRPPRLEQAVDHRVELLLRRIPRLEQVVVEVDDVDGVDRGVGVGVCGQQHAAGQREEVHRLFEELDAAHLRHPVVGDEHRDGVAAQLEFLERVQRVGPDFGAHDPVPLAVVAAQIAGDGARHRGVVVDGQDYGFAGLGLGSSHRLQLCARLSSGYAGRGWTWRC